MLIQLLFVTVIILAALGLFVHLAVPFYVALWHDVRQVLVRQQQSRRLKRSSKNYR